MQYNILVVKNRYKGKPKLKKYIDWFKEKTPITVVMDDHIETNFELSTKTVGNLTYKSNAIVGDDILDKLRTVVPKNKYHAVVLLYGNNLDGIRANVTNSEPIWDGTYLIQLCTDTDNGKKLNHELFHTFFHRLNAKGIELNDPMDVVYFNGRLIEYFNNDSVNAIPSNRSIALESLAPHWDEIVSFSKKMPENKPYSWFSMSESTGKGHTFSELDPKLRTILDISRGIAGVPFVITSGFRTPIENKAVGGVPNSSHIKGLAADILCTDNSKRTAMIRGILNCGSPVFLEVAKKHLHIDIDSSIHKLGDTIIEPTDD